MERLSRDEIYRDSFESDFEKYLAEAELYR